MKWTKNIILINLAVFGICHIFTFCGLHLENLFGLYPIGSKYFSPYQLLTHLFIHGNPEHLLSNMLFFLLTGPIVEKYLGDKFIKFYLLSGIFSSGLYCLGVNSGIIGASGAVFSVMTFSIFLFIKSKEFKTHFSQKIKVIFLIFLILSEIHYAVSIPYDNIGHWAHIFGAFFGCLYYLFSKSAQPEV